MTKSEKYLTFVTSGPNWPQIMAFCEFIPLKVGSHSLQIKWKMLRKVKPVSEAV
jgi:hypothetical protein